MTVSTFFTQALTVKRTATSSRDAIGALQIDTSSDVVVQGYIEPVTASEDDITRNTQVGDWWAFIPPDTDVTGWDRITYGSHTFDITAPPEPFTHPTSPGLDHIRIRLREVV